jgi:hypothetical protein
MAYSSATTSAVSKENNVIPKPSSENSFNATQSLNPDLSESYVRFIVMFLWMLSHVSTPQLQPLERRERPIILHRLPSPRQESSRASTLKTYRSAWAECSALYGYPLSPDRVPQPWNKGWSQNAATGPGDYPSLTTHLPITSSFIPPEITARVR